MINPPGIEDSTIPPGGQATLIHVSRVASFEAERFSLSHRKDAKSAYGTGHELRALGIFVVKVSVNRCLKHL
jgi:hypothetical protein